MPHPTAANDPLRPALARLDPRDILNFPDCAAENLVDRPISTQPPEPAPTLRGKDAD